MSLVHVLFLALYLPLTLLTKTDDIVNDNNPKVKTSETRYFQPHNDLPSIKMQHKVRAFEENLSHGSDRSSRAIRSSFRISNEDIEKRAQKISGFRRGMDKMDLYRNVIPPVSHDAVTSTDEDKKIWREKWITRWQNLKRDALEKAYLHPERGDVVAMTAARPWRTPCGDINQLDIPTGTCTMPHDCPNEYRMYRGDAMCGKTNFVCCGLRLDDYDMFQAFDPTFADSSRASTSSDEIQKAQTSRERRHRKRRRSKIRVIKARHRRKRLIKKTIRRLEKEIRRELNRAFRNNTMERRRTIHNLKILIASLKKKIRDERHVAMNKRNDDVREIDAKLQLTLNKVKQLNHEFLTNDTFRNLIYYQQGNGRAAPDVERQKKMDTRRSGGGVILPVKEYKKRKNYLEYDIEFGVIDID